MTKDISSGLNNKRKRYTKLLNRVLHNEVDQVVMVYEDRLTGLDTGTLQRVFETHGTQLKVLNPAEPQSQQQELVEDLPTLIAHFSRKLYGLRSHRYQEVLKDAKNLFTKP